ncbi:EAL domain-containing protein [Xanthobacter sp. KR7-65]|uniref:putative bifunctional diguanylate cyclase/phosphodiesterase n=1 Tax=Xanthobacter sp. KR7-65 TaxID=3156612 RepID=UPI0032B3EC03
MPPPLRPRRRSPGWLVLVGGLLIAAVLAATATLVASQRKDGIADRTRELDNLAITLAEQTTRAFKSLSLIQDDFIDEVREQTIETRAQLLDAMGSHQVHSVMHEKISGLPYVDALTMIDETGQLINFSRYWPIPKVNVADRDYFRALSTMRGPDTFISEPVPNRGTGTVTIYLARRFANAQGSFLGLVLGAMQQSYFERFYSNIRLGKDGMIALVRADGALLARHPGSAGLPPRDEAVRAQTAATVFRNGTNIELPPGTLDEKLRLAAVQPVENLPVAVVVSDSAAAIDAVLWQRATPLMVASGMLCLTIALATYGIGRHLRDERAFAEGQHAMARLDILTGLPNRLDFSERLEAMLAEPGGRPFALLFVDLDYFKAINDTLGHAAGDTLLVELAERLRRLMGPEDTVARLGGDEFAVLQVGAVEDEEAMEFAQHLIDAMRKPMFLGLHRVISGASVGIVLSPKDGTEVSQLLKNADLALYRAKTDGRGIARVFAEEMEQSARERREIEVDVQTAWRERQFFLVYQPIIEAKSGRIAGFEALVRWRHPVRGMIEPSKFIPVAEETGLILPLGAWVLQEACTMATRWPPDVFVSVNLSPIQFRGAEAFRQVRNALEVSGLEPSRLEVEITESTLLHEGPMVRATLEQFSEEGITVALDDFGTGYSSLGYLRTLSIGRIKVDRSFVDQVEESPQSLAIVRAIVGLARTLGLSCTAEGIETEGQRRILTEEGCTHLQGYLIGRPETGDEALNRARGSTTVVI